jgi:dihydrofolate reductase
VTELTADLFVSLDGFASGVDVGPYFGYGGPELDKWIHAKLEEPQLVVFGRRTYEAMATITSAGTDAMSQRLTALPKLVVTSTLSEPLQWANTRLVSGDAIDVLPAIKNSSQMPLRTMGSVSLVRNLMIAGIVDRLRLMVFPLTCGDAGRDPIFGQGELRRYELQQTQVFDARIVLLDYRTIS